MTTHTPTRAQDKALETLKRDAIKAIKRTEKEHARMQIADFKEQLTHRSYSDRVKLCLWWIVLAKDCDHD